MVRSEKPSAITTKSFRCSQLNTSYCVTISALHTGALNCDVFTSSEHIYYHIVVKGDGLSDRVHTGHD